MESATEYNLEQLIERILRLNLSLVNPGLITAGKISENKEQLIAILTRLEDASKELNTKSLYIQNRTDRLNEMVEMLLKYTLMDFSQKLIISDAGDELDAIALGLNTLGEELESHIKRLKENEAEMEKKTEDLLRSNKQLEQFVYIASHDLQEPLRTISNYVNLFEEDYKDKLAESSVKYLDRITKATRRMQLLITELLEYARVGRTQEAAAVDCNILLEEVSKDISASIEESGAVIQSGILPIVYGNFLELKSLFQNLISNAVKFRKKDVPLVVQINALSNPDEWIFAVKDNGIGIERKFHERIFLIFQKLHNEREYSGTGIGLAHCKKIVEVHKGRIWVESEPGTGSTFYFTIPKGTGQ